MPGFHQQTHGVRQWFTISREFADRTPGQCATRWRSLKSIDNFEPDAVAAERASSVATEVAVDRACPGNGKHRVIGDRSVLASAFRRHRRGPWTTEEEKRLCLAVHAMVPTEARADAPHRKRSRAKATSDVACNAMRAVDWNDVARLMGHTRSESQCRGKWFESLDPFVARADWTPREDEQLLKCESAWPGAMLCR